MLRIALKMLLADRAKYVMLVGSLSFATLLMIQQSSVFCGLMLWTTATLRNVRAKVWVVEPNVQQVNEIRPLRDTDVGRVRSVQGVAWGVPLFWTILQAKLIDGTFRNVQIIGLDSSTLVGHPAVMLQGSLEDLRLPNTIVIDELAIEKLSGGRAKPLGIGDIFEINDREARVVGICKAERSFLGIPYLYTTYEHALHYAPKTRKMLSFVLAEPAPGWTPEQTARRIEKETGLKAYTEEEFSWATMWWYVKNTGIPISFGTTIILGFFVGVAVSAQTFYAFVQENRPHLGALKAMGASNGLLVRMLLLQALSVGTIGYGCGVGWAALFGSLVIDKGQPPFFMPASLLAAGFFLILLICALAALAGIRTVARLEPAVVFRA